MVSQEDISLTEIVIEAVAQYKEVDETSLDQPLYNAINPDALNALFNGGPGEVTFRYLDLHVMVNSDRDVEVSDGGERG